MREYELMFIIKPDATEEAIADIKERLQGIIANFGGEFMEEVGGWGKRRMAYRIQDYPEGIYCLWKFRGEAATISELDRIIKITDILMRHIIVRKDEK